MKKLATAAKFSEDAAKKVGQAGPLAGLPPSCMPYAIFQDLNST